MSTKRAMLGPTVSNPQTRHPAVTAAAIASLNELSKGRAFLGLGSGDSAVLNLGLRPARLAELRHYIQTVRDLLAGESGEYAGGRATSAGPAPAIPLPGRPTPACPSPYRPRPAHPGPGRRRRRRRHRPHRPDAGRNGRHHRPHPRGRAPHRPPTRRTEVWAFAKCNIADRRDDAINEIKMALAASAHHAFRHTLDGKNVPPHLREPITILQQEYRPAEHEQTGPTRNAALTDELGLTDYLATRFRHSRRPRRMPPKSPPNIRRRRQHPTNNRHRPLPRHHNPPLRSRSNHTATSEIGGRARHNKPSFPRKRESRVRPTRR